MADLPMAGDVLPPEIVAEIFSRLPVKSLLRFRSSSKSLKSIIDSHNFTDLHLKNSLNFNLILRRNNTKLYQFDFPDLTSRVKLRFPFMCSGNRNRLLGSCNGLLCISSGINEFAFWNPNICKHRFIPYLIVPRYEPGFNFIRFGVRMDGFGFDSFAGDYKLVIVSGFVDLKHHTFDSQVRLFSSNTNSWKVLPNMPYAICFSQTTMGVFLENSNSLHWVVIPKLDGSESPLIVAFNLTQEVFNEVPLPETPATVDRHKIGVSLLGGCLCMIVNRPILEIDMVDVWVMKEYGFKDSWCKLFTLEVSCFDKPLISLKPLGYSSDRRKVLLEIDGRKLFWYDLKSEKVTCVLGIPNFNEAMVFVGSLLPPPLPIDN